jgi:hypothetical protein
MSSGQTRLGSYWWTLSGSQYQNIEDTCITFHMLDLISSLGIHENTWIRALARSRLQLTLVQCTTHALLLHHTANVQRRNS